MKRLKYILLLTLFVSCEEIYRPTIKEVEDLLVVEAVLISNRDMNSVKLYRARRFYDTGSYLQVHGANVYLQDDIQNQIPCNESMEGVYTLSQQLDEARKYVLYIELDGETYVSELQAIPDVPVLDTLYGKYEYKVSIDGTASSKEKIEKDYGFQLYSDIRYQGGTNHYRFDGKKILQYIEVISPDSPRPTLIYHWRTLYPTNSVNTGGPPEYSTNNNISKHPLEFFPQNCNKYLTGGNSDDSYMIFDGWIYIIYQYGLNEDTYNYYKKMKQQLDNEGKIFDPVYIQLKGNITCQTNPKIKVLGNFEISTFAEWRYFITYTRYDSNFRLKRINYFYDIPNSGSIARIIPDFWESMYKQYPDD